MMCIILVTTWASVAYYIVIGLAAVNAIPDDVMEAATIDGAGQVKKVFYIIIPMVWESIKISVVMIITGCLLYTSCVCRAWSSYLRFFFCSKKA